MFYRTIDAELKLSLTVPQYAAALFALTDANREFLSRWLPWPDAVTEPADSKAFINTQLGLFARGEALHVTIFYRETIAGVLGFNSIDQRNGIGYVGYWLARDYNGKGIMTRSVNELISLGWEYYRLNKIDIRCATENHQSRAIPERLGFRNEGTLRCAENVNGRYFDHVVYGLLKNDVSASVPASRLKTA